MASLGTRTLKIKIGATEYTAQCTRCVITSGEADSDVVTFADAAAGGAREYRLEFTAIQDLATGTLWDQVFTAAGTTVAFSITPYGATTATATAPFIQGNAIISEPDGDFIGGEADQSASNKMLFDGSWVLTGKPTRVTTGTF